MGVLELVCLLCVATVSLRLSFMMCTCFMFWHCHHHCHTARCVWRETTDWRFCFSD